MNNLLTVKKQIKFQKTRARHNRETAKALRKQLLIWAYNNAKANPIKFTLLQDKCSSINISRAFTSVIIKTNIMLQNDLGVIWNPELTNPDFDKLTEHAQNNERALKSESYYKNINIKQQKPVTQNNDLKLDIIIEKLNAISKAIGIQ